MASRDDNLKPTNQELAKVIRDREGISLEEAEKKQEAEAWKEEADALPVRLIHKRLDYNQKPLRYMLDPNEDPHRDLKSYGYEMKFKGQDFAFEIPMDLDQVSFDGSAKAITEHLNKPIFG